MTLISNAFSYLLSWLSWHTIKIYAMFGRHWCYITVSSATLVFVTLNLNYTGHFNKSRLLFDVNFQNSSSKDRGWGWCQCQCHSLSVLVWCSSWVTSATVKVVQRTISTATTSSIAHSSATYLGPVGTVQNSCLLPNCPAPSCTKSAKKCLTPSHSVPICLVPVITEQRTPY